MPGRAAAPYTGRAAVDKVEAFIRSLSLGTFGIMGDSTLPFEIDVQLVKRMLDQKDDFLLLDVREQDEYDTARIDGATLLPMSEIAQRAGELAPHQQRRIVVHCHHGGRSAQVTNWLRGQGFAQAQNLKGGIDQWSLDVDPSVPRY